MNNTITTPFSIQAKSLFKYERNANQPKSGKKMDTTVTVTGTGIIINMDQRNRTSLRSA